MSGANDISYFPLTHGQAAMMKRLADLPAGRRGAANIIRRFGVDPPAPISDVTTAFRLLSRRHSALRTTIDLEHGDDPWQAVQSSPVLPVSVCRQGHLEDAIESLRKADLLSPRDLLWRAVVYAPGGSAIGIGIAVHHVICDARGVEVLAEQLLALIAGNHEPAGRRSLDAAELALLQRSRGTDERTLRYFSKIYRSMPALPFDEGAVTGDGRRYVARFSLRSSAGRVRRTADACEVSSHSVMLTLSVLLFGELSESVSGVFQVFGENRAIPELRETIDCLTQDVPLLYRFRYDEPFADVCRRIHRSSMRAYAVGPWDVGRVGELRADIERERHLSLRVNQDFNYLAARGGPTAAAAPGHLDQTERHAVQTVDGHGGSVFSVKVVDQEGIRVDITASPALVSRARMAGLDDAVESCLSCVSADASISVGRLMPVITRALGRRR